MADFETNRAFRSPADVTGAVDAGLRAHMLRVYNYMFLALLVTGATAYLTYQAALAPSPDTAAAVLPNGVALTSLGVWLFASPLRYVVIFAPVGVYLFIAARLRTMSLGGAQSAFWIFSGLMGVSFGSIFLVYALSSIAQVFFITAAAFGGLSLYGYTTKRDLSAIGSFLVMGAWGLFIALIVNMFLHSSMLMWIASVAGVGIFAGLTAYDTQRTKEMYYAGDDGTVAGKKSILASLALYLDFINMFQFLLFLVGNRR